MSILKSIFDTVKDLIKGITGGGSIVDLLVQTLLKLPEMIKGVEGVLDATAEVQIDEGLLAFDEMTGSDEGALDLIKTMPPEMEEQTCDALKIVVGNILKNKAKVAGYYIAE